MCDAVSATLTTALDAAAEDVHALDREQLASALDESRLRREALERAGVRVDESPYLHFLRRFAGETAPAELAASA
ncbi:MAG: hypothetical protein J0M02_01190 [Planctomycetes bacterium]|nr:hypothetical protein [Planctomycetota bacterium]